MTTLATAAIAAASIAFTPTQASADGDDIAKIIAGLAVAGIVAKVIEDRQESGISTRTSRYPDSSTVHGQRVIEGRIRPYERYDSSRGDPSNRGYKKQALPKSCLLTVRTSYGDRLAYGSRCVNQTYKYAHKLPRNCVTGVKTPRGFRTVYGARCLRRDGWVVARR